MGRQIVWCHPAVRMHHMKDHSKGIQARADCFSESSHLTRGRKASELFFLLHASTEQQMLVACNEFFSEDVRLLMVGSWLLANRQLCRIVTQSCCPHPCDPVFGITAMSCTGGGATRKDSRIPDRDRRDFHILQLPRPTV